MRELEDSSVAKGKTVSQRCLAISAQYRVQSLFRRLKSWFLAKSVLWTTKGSYLVVKCHSYHPPRQFSVQVTLATKYRDLVVTPYSVSLQFLSLVESTLTNFNRSR